MKSRMVIVLPILAILASPSLPTAAQDATPVGAAPAAPSGRTDVRYFLPYGTNGLNPSLQVAGRVSGTCRERSNADFGRPDAWFCTESGTGGIHDPCFANPFGAVDAPATLACASSPFTSEVILVTTTEALPRRGMNPPRGQGAAGGPAGQGPDPLDLPWGIELANGKRCGLLTGATNAFAGMRINYGCEGGGLIVGQVDRSQPIWVVNYYDEAATGTSLADVSVVWT